MQVPKAQSPPVATVLLLLVAPLKNRCAAAAVDLVALQTRLGPKIQVLLVDEATHPAIVRSFAPVRLPSSVLLHQGTELWRQNGLPNATKMPAALLAKIEHIAS
ncbi:thioredoxin [Hymenobacter lucidus]|uniref:Thioredoxin n=1 Tax=Hymenobacter lucidus TaxID=2880930 RepID=A0ABS8ALB7_9BACT|nr:thioredoxin [Hymenobacter lucidus]MCB2407003.1 thioredoxin [Hymenobacter lucidus]